MLIIDRYPAKGHTEVETKLEKKSGHAQHVPHWMPGLPGGSWVLLASLQLGLESLDAS